MLSAALAAFAGIAVACAGCAARRDPAQEARVVSEINTFCRQLNALPPSSRRPERQTRWIQIRAHALERALKASAAYLPAGKDLNDAHAERRALFAEDSRRSAGGASRRAARFDRLELRIYQDELALGVRCAGIATEVRRLRNLRGASP